MSKWIPLMVRLEDYAELAAEVAVREARRPVERAEGAHATWTVSDEPTMAAPTKAEELLASLKPWSLADLRRIHDTADKYKTMARWAKAMDVVCQRPGPDGFLSTSEVAERSGMTINEWRDAPRKLPQHLKAHFPANIGWPLQAVSGRSLGRDDQVYWGITAEQANRWVLARAASASGEPR